MSDENTLSKRRGIDWEWCGLCQQKSNKDLQCPYKMELKAFQTLEKDLISFAEASIPLPLGVTLERLNDGSRSHNLQRAKKKSQAPPLFHAFTGCDVVSAMYGIGKKIDDIDPSDVEKPNITLLWLGSENVI